MTARAYKIASSIAATALYFVGSAAIGATQYQFTAFVLPGAVRTALWDINNHGVMVGVGNDGAYDYGFVVSEGFATKVSGPIGGKGASLVGISDDGVAVGALYDADGLSHPMLYSNGSYSVLDLGDLGWNGSLRGISPDGRFVTGFVSKSNGGGYVGFAYDLILGQVAGIMPGGPIQLTTGVNNFGQVVGDSVLPNFSRIAYVYDIPTMTYETFWFSAYSRVAPRGINENGVMSGWLDSGTGPMAWVGTTSEYQLLGTFQGQHLVAAGNNDSGQIVGSMRDGLSSFIATPTSAVPEPATWLLAVLGIGLIAIRPSEMSSSR